jgi:hypothetical protein
MKANKKQHSFIDEQQLLDVLSVLMISERGGDGPSFMIISRVQGRR